MFVQMAILLLLPATAQILPEQLSGPSNPRYQAV
jgi:hypothetical protein